MRLLVFDETTVYGYGGQPAAQEGERGAVLWAVPAADGRKLAEQRLDSLPVFDGLAAAAGRLYMATESGDVVCLAGR